MILAILMSLFQDVNHTYDLNTKWKSFCERHLISNTHIEDDDETDE